MTEIPKEKRLELAIEAFHKGQFPSKTACAKAFDVPPRTLMTRLDGTVSRQHTIANCRKLSNTEEESLKNWILDMDKRGLPLQVSNVRHLAQLLLSARSKPSKDISISEKWVSRSIQRHPEIWHYRAGYIEYKRDWISNGCGITCKGYLWIRDKRYPCQIHPAWKLWVNYYNNRHKMPLDLLYLRKS